MDEASLLKEIQRLLGQQHDLGDKERNGSFTPVDQKQLRQITDALTDAWRQLWRLRKLESRHRRRRGQV